MSTMTDDDLKFILGRLHKGYIVVLADEIRAKVGSEGRPLAVAYEPGDGTRYVLVFTPLDLPPVTERAHVRRGWGARGEEPELLVEEARGVDTGLGIGPYPDGRFALISLVDHGAYPFELFHKGRASGACFDPGYVGDKLGIRSGASAIAVCALLNEIARPTKAWI